MFILTMIILSPALAHKSELITKYRWEKTPTIEICKESNVTANEVKNALNYWQEELGKQKIVNQVKVDYNCTNNKLGVIQIDSDFEKGMHADLADTHIKWFTYKGESTKYIDRAAVSIPNDLSYKRQLVITHEIGHALGFNHSSHEVMKSRL